MRVFLGTRKQKQSQLQSNQRRPQPKIGKWKHRDKKKEELRRSGKEAFEAACGVEKSRSDDYRRPSPPPPERSCSGSSMPEVPPASPADNRSISADEEGLAV